MPLITNSSEKKHKIDPYFEEISSKLKKSITNIIEKEHFTFYDLGIKNFVTKGDNFLGKLYEVKIKGKTPIIDKELNLFIKEKIISEDFDYVDARQIFANEEFMYKDLSKIINTLQDEANVPQKDRYKIAKAFDETNNDAIVLENLCVKGFSTIGKDKPVTLKFVELAVQELAKLQAFSFIIENQMPEFFKRNIAVLQHPIYYNETWKDMMRNICGYIAHLYDNETKVKIENYVPILLAKLPKYQTDKPKISALLHGDYKKNNIMVRMVDGEATEVIPVDYQLLDYGCPVRDFLYFIFSSTDREFRKKHLNNLKELYFQTLTRFLRYFTIDVETVFPRTEFDGLYTEWLDYGLMMTLFASMAIFTPDTGLEYQNQSSEKLQFRPDKKYHYILRGLVDDFVKWGYL